MRIAEALAESHNVTVMQKGRDGSAVDGKAVYSGLKMHLLESERFDAIIVLRTAYPLLKLKQLQPRAKLFLWLHDLAGQHTLADIPIIKATGAVVVTVSDFHRTQWLDMVQTMEKKIDWTTRRIYNPVADDLQPDATPVNPNKLVFFSSPHKGLDYALRAFTNLRNFNPAFELHISNPGYMPSGNTSGLAGVVNHGALAHHEAIKIVRESLCVFYPNHVFPETFGLVMAEANAVGTPVITHGLGAAHEVLRLGCQMVDTRNLRVLIDRVLMWHNGGRPKVQCRDEFRLSNVVKEWGALCQ